MTGTRGIVFALDGVLVDTDETSFRAWATVASRLGIAFGRDDHARLRGLSRSETLDAILALGDAEVSRTEKELLADERTAIHRELVRGLSPRDIDPAVPTLLADLRARGLRLAVASASRSSRMILERTGLRDRFDAVSDGANMSRREPDPEGLLRAADLLALPAYQCAAVVSTREGAGTAHAGGFGEVLGLGDAAAHPDVTRALASVAGIAALVSV
ncbi:HAD hydrolase-like protein [Demequina sp. SYSU T00039]|uniref:HAD hydrolase-like protein n=1 Tax=Demequina lignilytica TaxID=3051663 RepID=A0AAW7M4W1_9MICO|nr:MULTISPECIES: HAD family hydrolase [unclassified Demequina]MDN4486856.1 HAD hydrolase-like protein [Demequina sp. SYSU T00039]MDN4489540.1 HAD hydrolase-like protein [Demequina sp. SYSU T00068]